MNPKVLNWSKRTAWFVLVAVCLYSFFSAVSNWVVMTAVRTAGVPPAPDVQTVSTTKDKKESLAKFKVINSRNLFDIDVDLVKEEPKEPPPTAESQIVESSLPGVLIGTLAGGDENSLAIIQDNRNRKVQVYKVGDTVLEMAVLVKVERLRAIVERNGKREELILNEDDKPAAKKGSKGKSAAAKKEVKKADVEVVERSENEFVIDKDQFENALNDMSSLLSSARVVPNFKDGKIDGYKIFAIRSGSLYEKIGLENGDIIDSVNGLVIETPEKAMVLFQQLRSEDHFDLEIRRDDTPVSLSYDLE